MKKCPSCEKTFEDNMKFCQSDGTPLIVVEEETPSDDPYKTMVASDIPLPPSESKEDVESGAEAPPAPAEESRSTPPQESADAPDEASDVLEVPKTAEHDDPMKTVVVTGTDTSGNLEVPDMPNVVPPAPEPAAFEGSEAVSETSESDAETVIAPQIPKFSEPDIKPPELFSGDEKEDVLGITEADAPDKPESKPSVPIPSPFEESMPPGFVPPSDPPFSKDSIPVPEREPEPVADAATPPPSPFAEAPEPETGSAALEPSVEAPAAVASPGSDPFGNNSILSAAADPSGAAEGENKTLAIVSLVSGIVSVLCCVLAIVVGPVAVITGYMARSKIGQDPAQYGGGTMAMIGMILGAIGFVLFLVWFVLQVLGSLPALMNSF